MELDKSQWCVANGENTNVFLKERINRLLESNITSNMQETGEQTLGLDDVKHL